MSANLKFYLRYPITGPRITNRSFHQVWQALQFLHFLLPTFTLLNWASESIPRDPSLATPLSCRLYSRDRTSPSLKSPLPRLDCRGSTLWSVSYHYYLAPTVGPTSILASVFFPCLALRISTPHLGLQFFHKCQQLSLLTITYYMAPQRDVTRRQAGANLEQGENPPRLANLMLEDRLTRLENQVQQLTELLTGYLH